MNEITALEKSFIDTNTLILDGLQVIGVKWNHPNNDIEPYMKVESVEKLMKLDEIKKGIEEIEKNLEKIKSDHKNHEKYAQYFHKMNESYVKAAKKLEVANKLKAASLNKTNSRQVALAYLAPFLGYLNELSEASIIKHEKSILLGKIGWYYHRKALNLGAKLAFKAMPNLIYAKKLYFQSWDLDQKNYDSAHGLAKCMYKLSKHRTCIQYLTEEFKLDEQKKSVRDYYRILAICYRKIGDYSNAQKMIGLGLNLTPNDPKVKKESDLIKKLVEKKKTEPFKDTLFYAQESEKSKYKEQDFVHRHTESNEFRILSVDGGGIRGIIPAYWACEIEKRAHKPISHLFNMLAGTSTGGIVAAGLSFPKADGVTPKFAAYELLDVYRHRGNKIFPATSWLQEKIDIVKSIFGSRYQDTGRKGLFQELVGKDSLDQVAKISSALTELVITTANEDCIITTHLFNRFDARYDEYFNDTFVDTLMCTSAAPYYFPSYEIQNKGYFVDGGVHVNNPADVAFSEARRYGISVDRISMVSMGTGAYVPGLINADETSWRSKCFNNQANLKARGALYWAAHLKDVALEGQCGNTDISLGSMFNSKYQRMQVWFENAITLDQVDEQNVTLLTDIASQYVEEEDDTINKLVESLVRDL